MLNKRLVKKDPNYLKNKKNPLWYRSRGFEKLEGRFGNNKIKTKIQNLIKKNKPIKILEIGFGEGLVLLELQKNYPKIQMYGINKEKTKTMSKKNDFIKNAKIFNINISEKKIPLPYFYDVSDGLKFKSNFFDIIVSQVAIHYVGNKAKLIEEIWRVLKKGGNAYLHIDGKLEGNQPEFMNLHKDTPRFIIYKKGRIISTKKYINSFKKKGFNLKIEPAFNNPKQFILLIEKTLSHNLKLKLEYDGNSTLYLTPLKLTDEFKYDGTIWWGTRSIFKIN